MTSIPTKYIAYFCAIVPILSVHLTLLIALLSDNLHVCNPYWSYCHSISATGRQYPEFFVFKGLMIPVAVAMGVYWLLLNHWLLRQLQNVSPQPSQPGRTIVILGITASLALIVYTVTLGAKGEPYALARRIGVILFFGFSAFAHLVLLAKLNLPVRQIPNLKLVFSALFRLCFLLIGLGLGSAILGFVWDGYNNWDNAIEWWFALLMMGQFYLVGRMWQITNYRIELH